MLIYAGYKLTNHNSKGSTEEENDVVINTVGIEENTIVEAEDSEERVNVDFPSEIKGHKVIEKLGIKKEILSKTNDEALNLSVTKFYGPNVNEIGNFCITGHNYKNMIKEVKNLKVGDTFYLINRENQSKVTYQIFDIYTCDPNDLECLDARNSGTKEVTLITCNPGGLTRLIIKAKAA